MAVVAGKKDVRASGVASKKVRQASGAAGRTKATRVGGWLRGIKAPFLCDAAVQPIVHPGKVLSAAVTAFWVPW